MSEPQVPPGDQTDRPQPGGPQQLRHPPRQFAALFLMIFLVWMLWILFTAFGIGMMWVWAKLFDLHGLFDAEVPANGNMGRVMTLLVMAWTAFSLMISVVVSVRLHRRLRQAQAADMAADQAANSHADPPEQ